MRGMTGVVSGIVKSVDDPDGLGRIELKFPSIDDSISSYWARVAAPLAGAQRGAFFMPELEDEVLVAFEHGDFDHPYIVGFLWNGADKPPETTNQNRVIKTPGGHQLRFEDTVGAKKVILKSDGGHEIEIDDQSQTITVQTKSANQSIVLSDATQSVRIRGGQRIIEMVGGVVQIS